MSGSSVQALPGQIVFCDPTSSSVSVSSPSSPQAWTTFGVADATAQSGVHAINVLSSGSAYVLESPASPGTYSNSVTIASASRVRLWVWISGVGWKLYSGVF